MYYHFMFQIDSEYSIFFILKDIDLLRKNIYSKQKPQPKTGNNINN